MGLIADVLKARAQGQTAATVKPAEAEGEGVTEPEVPDPDEGTPDGDGEEALPQEAQGSASERAPVETDWEKDPEADVPRGEFRRIVSIKESAVSAAKQEAQAERKRAMESDRQMIELLKRMAADKLVPPAPKADPEPVFPSDQEWEAMTETQRAQANAKYTRDYARWSSQQAAQSAREALIRQLDPVIVPLVHGDRQRQVEVFKTKFPDAPVDTYAEAISGLQQRYGLDFEHAALHVLFDEAPDSLFRRPEAPPKAAPKVEADRPPVVEKKGGKKALPTRETVLSKAREAMAEGDYQGHRTLIRDLLRAQRTAKR